VSELARPDEASLAVTVEIMDSLERR